MLGQAIRSTHPLERLNKEIKRRVFTNVPAVRVFVNCVPF